MIVPVFATERLATDWLVERLAPHVAELGREVYLRHPLHAELLRIDLLLAIENFRPGWSRPALVGVEIKTLDGGFKDWTAAAAQAHSYLVAGLVKPFGGYVPTDRPMWVFVWPDIRDTARYAESSLYACWMEGAERLAGRQCVGSLRTIGDGRDFLFTMAASPMYSTRSGPRGAPDQSTRQQVGAR